MIDAIIIDDEFKGIEILKILLKKYCPEVNVVGWAEEIDGAIELIDKKQPDLIFLDIEMSGESGFDLLEKVKPNSFHVIFVTAHSEYAVRAFRYSVSGYLLKPVDTADLLEAVQKVKSIIGEEQISNDHALKKKSEPNYTLKIPLNQGSVFVKMSDVIRIEADGAYTHIYLTGKRNYLVSYNIKVVEEHLDHSIFIRVHRSHIINLSKVTSVSGETNQITMCDGSLIQISRRIRTNFIALFEGKSQQ